MVAAGPQKRWNRPRLLRRGQSSAYRARTVDAMNRIPGGHAGGATVCHAHLAPGPGCEWTVAVQGGGGYRGAVPGSLCRVGRLDAHRAGLARGPGPRQWSGWLKKEAVY